MSAPEIEVEVEAPGPARRRRSVRAVAWWLVALAVSLLLAGPWGAVAPVLVAAVLLAELPRRLIGLLGAACVAAVPVAVAVVGLPTLEDLSPAFVRESLVPHHLMYTGLALVGAWAVLDLAPAVRARRFAVEEVPVDEDRRAGPAAVALVVLVALGALAASWAVLGG